MLYFARHTRFLQAHLHTSFPHSVASVSKQTSSVHNERLQHLSRKDRNLPHKHCRLSLRSGALQTQDQNPGPWRIDGFQSGHGMVEAASHVPQLVHQLQQEPISDVGAFRGRQEHRLHARFRTQANALFRKNGMQQRRAWVQTLVIVALPIVFCILLFILQRLLNKALDTPENRCGCFCNQCFKTLPDGTPVVSTSNSTTLPNGTVVTASTPGGKAYYAPCKSWDECEVYDESNCGLQWSDSGQAAFCAIPTPSTWPALAQVPRMDLSQQEPLQVAALYTGQDRATADAIAAYLFFNPNTTALQNTTALAQLLQSNTSVVYASAFSTLGLVLGTMERGRDYYSNFIEPGFVSAQYFNSTILDLVNDSASPASEASEANLAGILDLARSAGVGQAPTANITQVDMVWQANADDINTQTYCAYRQARCDGTPSLQAWDFSGTSATALSMRLWYNATLRGRDGPPTILRVNQGLNRATNAFLKWALGGDARYQAWLSGVMEMPKGGSRLSLDFGSLLGPLFYSWLLQLLLPVMLYQLVYEKERRLRTMMKMHGLGDVAYWAIQYCWFFVVNFVFVWILIIFGSGINLSFFRRTNYSFQFVFYLLWINCLIAFSFLLSSMFRSSKTAVVVGFLYVFGTGLVGFLLIQQFVASAYWWVIFLELVPGWALYRSLYEISQYAFRASTQDTQGITWSNLSDDNNGLPGAMIIMAVEWAVFMAAAWYLEQVLDTGVGVPRHPLFFLGWSRRGEKKGAAPRRRWWPWGRREAASSVEEAVTIPVEAEDVRAERLRVEAMPPGEAAAAIAIRDLQKTFPASGGSREKVAVRGLTLAIERGECFGLLGPNGAGKSTTLNILTGFLEPTDGTAIVEGHDIRSDMPTIYSLMGVCPQDNLLWERLTAREHLYFFGRLKNLRGRELAAAVDAALQSVNLYNGGVGDKQVRTYSGGMKRRLSVAISFIGDPLVVYLDEPSTGLDPASRQNLWSVVKAAKQQRGIILTTHSMEEATVLCDRLGIFVDGQLVCIGNPKELTARHGGYYVFTITTPTEQEEAADALVRRVSPGARLTYALAGTRKYELPVGEVTLPGVFEAMAGARQHLEVLDWGIANATLEEVFIRFAKNMGLEAGAF